MPISASKNLPQDITNNLFLLQLTSHDVISPSICQDLCYIWRALTLGGLDSFCLPLSLKKKCESKKVNDEKRRLYFTLFGVGTVNVWMRKLYAEDHAKFWCSHALMKDLEIELVKAWAGTHIYHSSKLFSFRDSRMRIKNLYWALNTWTSPTN